MATICPPTTSQARAFSLACQALFKGQRRNGRAKRNNVSPSPSSPAPRHKPDLKWVELGKIRLGVLLIMIVRIYKRWTEAVVSLTVVEKQGWGSELRQTGLQQPSLVTLL